MTIIIHHQRGNFDIHRHIHRVEQVGSETQVRTIILYRKVAEKKEMERIVNVVRGSVRLEVL